MWSSDDGDACVGLWLIGGVSTVEDCVAHDAVHFWSFHVSLRHDQHVQSVVFHCLDDSVDLACLHESCGVPAPNVELEPGREFDIMCGSVGCGGLQDM